MLHKQELAPIVEALLDSHGDAHDAVFALVSQAANAGPHGDRRYDLLTGAQAIAIAYNSERAAIAVVDEHADDFPPLEAVDAVAVKHPIKRIALDELEKSLNGQRPA